MRGNGKKPPASAGEKLKKEAARRIRKKGRRAALKAARARLGLDGKKPRSAEKQAMYSAWMDRAKEDADSDGEGGASPVYLAVSALYGAAASLSFWEGARTRRKGPYWRGFAYLALCGAYAAVDFLRRTGE